MIVGKERAFILCIWLTFALAAVLWILYVTAALLSTVQALQAYEPPTQINRLEQDIIHDLQQRVEGLEGILSEAEVYQITAYADSCGNGDGYTATMARPTVGRTIAVDPRKIPLGSRVWIEGLGVFIAEDIGGAVKGNVIDVYVGDYGTAIEWGRRLRKVVVL